MGLRMGMGMGMWERGEWEWGSEWGDLWLWEGGSEGR